MNFQGAETILNNGFERARQIYKIERKNLQSLPNSYLQKTVNAYQDRNVVIRAAVRVLGGREAVRYDVACQLLEERAKTSGQRN